MSALFETRGPGWFSIPAHRPFLADLARGLLEALPGQGADGLPAAVVLLPTRRAARDLAQAFLTASGGRPLLLPQVRVLGDLDEGESPFEAGDIALDLPPAIDPSRRRYELAGLVFRHQTLLARRVDAQSALELADALAAFLDARQIEERNEIEAVDGLVEGELARHWRVSADFLALATRAWPARLAQLGLMDVAERRAALTRRLAEAWAETPPQGPLIAAGSTGSAPATADLLAAVAAAPRGATVLPGLDLDLAESAWREVGESHPQGTMKRLLARIGVDREQVRVWPVSGAADRRGRWRRRVINEALRPPESTADWLAQIRALRAEADDGADPLAQGLAGLSLIETPGEEEAAAAAALLLRESLETPGATAALITPDEALARRVAARLARWGVTADSSVGGVLAGAACGVLAALLTRAMVDPADPVTLLALAKHPLTRLGLDPEALARGRRDLERRALRGPRADHLSTLRDRLPEGQPEAVLLFDRLAEALDALRAPLQGQTAAPTDLARALAEAMERLSTDPSGGGAQDVWIGQNGEALARLIAGLIDGGSALPATSARGFNELFEGLLSRERVRPGGATHPRLRILGVLEARMIRADRLVLAGLEEGTWPQGPGLDPLLSRPMRAALGLPPPERRLGLSAHDFAQAACAPDVTLIVSARRGDSPALPSRWIWRLKTLAKGAGLTVPGRPDLAAWVAALDRPLETPPRALLPAPRPRPTPPIETRPVEMGVTGVQEWIRDPYAVYARRVLKLRAMERPDEPIEARARGIAVHKAFERFAREHPGDPPANGEAIFADLLVECLRQAGMPGWSLTRETARARSLAPWVIALERRRRSGAHLLVEQKGELILSGPHRPFKVTARADRIEHRGGVADIIDYKTGAAPSFKMMRTGLAPQLPLTAAILEAGGFEGLPPLDAGELVHLRVTGGRVPGQERVMKASESPLVAQEALSRLRTLVARYESPGTPYLSWVAPQFQRSGGDYDHLARVWEWRVIGSPADFVDVADSEGGPGEGEAS